MAAGKRQGAPEEKRPAGRERRQAPRILVNIEVDYGNKDHFLFAYIKDISATGIFVRTDTPEPPGTRLNLRFTPTRGGRVLDLGRGHLDQPLARHRRNINRMTSAS
jgi:hypothetical protein